MCIRDRSDTARLMLANSEFLILLNQATTDRDELCLLYTSLKNGRYSDGIDSVLLKIMKSRYRPYRGRGR